MTQVDWHPYPETKPRRLGYYLVTAEGETSPVVVEMQWTHQRKFGIATEHVIAWAELPEPYDPDGENEK